MKGDYGMTEYYLWFTAMAAEISETLQDNRTAYLCYKSIEKLERSTEMILPVYGHDGVQDGVLGRSGNYSHLPLASRSGNHFVGMKHQGVNDGGIMAIPLPTLIQGHTSVATTDSKIGNHLVPNGSLQERIRRSAEAAGVVMNDYSNMSLVVGTFGDVATANNSTGTAAMI